MTSKLDNFQLFTLLLTYKPVICDHANCLSFPITSIAIFCL